VASVVIGKLGRIVGATVGERMDGAGEGMKVVGADDGCFDG
jgi:hypothetical protein